MFLLFMDTASFSRLINVNQQVSVRELILGKTAVWRRIYTNYLAQFYQLFFLVIILIVIHEIVFFFETAVRLLFPPPLVKS